MNRQQKILLAVSVMVALFVGFEAGNLFVEQPPDTQPPRHHVMVLDTPQQLAIPALQQAHGEGFDTASLQGHWSLLFFGYMHCPDICPATLSTLAQAKQRYMKQQTGIAEDPFPRVVFISVDPDRDDADSLAEYVHYFDKEFMAVTGEEKLLRAITTQTYANFRAEPSTGEAGYLVNHSTNLALINPAAQLVAVLSPPHTVESILDALQRLSQSR